MEYTTPEILTIDSVEIGYTSGKRNKILLPPLTATAREGEFITVIGRNGIGKSTLLRTLTGLQPALGGKIFYNNKNITEYSRLELSRMVGYISTEIVRVSNMTVYDLVALGRFPHTNWAGKLNNEDHDAVMDSINQTGILQLSDRYISELSDGERQRAMIARILAQNTNIMIMDEPTAFLDIGNKYEILHLLHDLSRKNRKTIIFSTHDLDTAIDHSDKIWLITDNELKEGAPEDLMLNQVFENLFSSSSVRFNPAHGTFIFRKEERGRIFVEAGEDTILKHWTEKAVRRAGFSISDVKTTPFVSIKTANENAGKWQLIFNDKPEMLFTSLYELVSCLSSNKSSAYLRNFL